MSASRLILTAAVCIAFGQSCASAAPGLDKQLETQITNLVKSAKQAQLKSVLVVIREDQRSRPDRATPEVLNAIQARIERAIKRAGLAVADGTAARKIARARKVKRLPKSSEVVKFRGETKFDALVAVDYRSIKPGQGTMRITMLDDVDRLFLTTARVPTSLLEEGRKRTRNSQDAAVGRPNLNPTRIAGLGALIQAAQAQGIGRSAVAGSRPSAGSSESQPKTGNSKTKEGRAAAPTGDRNAGAKAAPNAAAKPKPNAGPVEPNAAKLAVDKNPDIGRLNKKVVEFCVANLGKQVGNGECWTLANEALIYARAKPAVRYTFGRPVGLGEVIPGDILQFTSVRFDIGNSYALMGVPNHTAVVYSVQGKNIFILQQNFGKRIVTTYQINFDNMTRGKAAAFRPVSR